MRKDWIRCLSVMMLLSSLIYTGCSKNQPVGPSAETNGGTVSFALATDGEPDQNIVSGQVTIRKGSLTEVQNVAIENYAGSVTFSNIQVGTWSIAISLYDADGVEIYSGEGEAVINKDRTTTVSITVSHNTGTLVIYIETDEAKGTIDLVNNTQSCDQLTGVTFVVPPANHQAVMKINLDPANGYRKVRFDLTYGETVSGWTLNIGDSSTNGGYGGDADTQWNDSEFQIVNTEGALYASDFVPDNPTRLLMTMPGLIAPLSNSRIEISNEHLQYNGTDYESPYIFALDGQSDPQGVNYDIYVGLNRVISGTSRNGSGLEKVVVTLLK